MSLDSANQQPGPIHESEPEHAPAGGLHWKSITTWIIFTCVAVFVIDWLLGEAGFRYRLLTRRGPYPPAPNFFTPIEAWGYFSADLALFRGEVWRFITFQFLHASTFHLIFNMVSLYFFGPMIEEYLGRK